MVFYAVQIHSGRELFIADNLEQIISQKGINDITRVFVAKEEKLNLAEKKQRVSRICALPSYLFIEVQQLNEEGYCEMPNHIYHLLKMIPGIMQPMKDNIPAAEMDEFLTAIGVTEMKVVFEVPSYITDEPETIDESNVEYLMPTTIHHKQGVIEAWMDKLKGAYSKQRKKSSTLAQKLYYHVSTLSNRKINSKYKISLNKNGQMLQLSLPMSLVMETIDISGDLSYEELINCPNKLIENMIGMCERDGIYSHGY